MATAVDEVNLAETDQLDVELVAQPPVTAPPPLIQQRSRRKWAKWAVVIGFVISTAVISRLAGWATSVGPGAVLLAVFSPLWSESALAITQLEGRPILIPSKPCGPNSNSRPPRPSPNSGTGRGSGFQSM